MRSSAWCLVATCCLWAMGCNDSDKDKNIDAGGVKDTSVPPDSKLPADAKPTADTKPAADGSSQLRWYRTCGDPSCRPAPDAGVSNACSGNQKEGEPCSDRDASCNLADACGARLLCTDKAPDLNNCPISRRRHKRAIRYLGAAEREALLAELLRLRLARYRLKGASAKARPKLGFIIDDKPPSVTVQPDGETVDLYGFTSLVAAAVQAQAKTIARQSTELAALRAELERLRQRR